MTHVYVYVDVEVDVDDNYTYKFFTTSLLKVICQKQFIEKSLMLF